VAEDLLILRSSDQKWWKVGLGFLGFLLATVWITATEDGAFGGFGWLLAAMWLVGLMVPLFMVVWPPELWVERDSFTMHQWGRRRRYEFAACGWFATLTIRGTDMIVFDHPYERPPSWFRRLNDAVAGASHALPGISSIPASEVAELLNERRMNVLLRQVDGRGTEAQLPLRNAAEPRR
jgi:hypothetical protein